MKRLFLISLFFSTFFSAQEIEDLQEGYFYSEGSKSFFRVDIKKPFDYYKVANCSDNSNFVRAQFEGGDAHFSRELFKYISSYVDKEVYVVNGDFFLHFDVDTVGNISNIEVTPKVANSEFFTKDLALALRKIKKTWTPSKCDGIPVNSKIRIKLNFVTEITDS
ncbi:MAG: hypothetical protein BGO40_04300 [Chryseobacterium sp. 39-10]|nr:hypothetical protein [Chryseobacterium sp.]OJV48933.1 MAG: hypothetical protein BGO40_04300 [Chryseobacterium sp. 39-10]